MFPEKCNPDYIFTNYQNYRCNGHIINLSVQAFLFGSSSTAVEDIGNGDSSGELIEEKEEWRKLGPLGKAHNIAVHSRKTPQRIQHFRTLSAGSLIKKDNSTRWNSWHGTLESILRPEIRQAIDIYIDENPSLEGDRIERHEWKLLEKIKKILTAFVIATKATEGQGDTLTKVLPSIDFLLDQYKKALQENSTNRVLSSMIRIGWEKLDKYFSATDRAPVYLAAVVLNPKFKWHYFETKWEEGWVVAAKNRLRNYWLSYLELTRQRGHGQAQERVGIEEGQREANNVFEQWMNIAPEAGEGQDEYNRYCSNAEPEVSVQNPLQ